MKNHIVAATLVTGLLLGYLPTNASAGTIESVTWDENKQIISQSYQAAVTLSTVPEPGALSLFGLAIAGLMAARYRKQA